MKQGPKEEEEDPKLERVRNRSRSRELIGDTLRGKTQSSVE